MIIRSWDGATRATDAEAYAAYMERTGIATLTATPGCLGAEILRRVEDDRALFRVESRWESVDAMRAFAGDDPTVARFFPEDDAYLVDRDWQVRIWEAVASAGSATVPATPAHPAASPTGESS